MPLVEWAGRISSDGFAPNEWEQPALASKQLRAEWLRGLVPTKAPPIEWSSGVTAAAVLAPLESLQGIRLSTLVALEIIQEIRKSVAASWEASGVAHTSIEWLQGIDAGKQVYIEWVGPQTIYVWKDIPAEWLEEFGIDSQPPNEYLTTIAPTKLAPWESLTTPGPIDNSVTVYFEALGGLHPTRVVPVEWGSVTYVGANVQYESVQWIYDGAYAAIEYLRGITDPVTVYMESGQGLTASRQCPLEWGDDEGFLVAAAIGYTVYVVYDRQTKDD